MRRCNSFELAVAGFLVALAAPAAFATPAMAPAGDVPGIYQAWNDAGMGGLGTLNGDLTVTIPANDVHATLNGYGNFQSMQGGVEIHAALTVDAQVSASGSFETIVPLAAIPLPPIPVNANLQIQPIVGFLGALAGDVEAGARFAFAEQLETTIDLSFDASGMSFSLFDGPYVEHHVATPEITGATGSTVGAAIIVGIMFEFVYAGIPLGGPTIAAAFTLGLEADPVADPWWDLDGDLEVLTAWVGPGFSLSIATLFSQHYDFADAGGPFPGAGGTSTRWSKSYDLGDVEDATAVLPLTGGFIVVGNGTGASCRQYLAKLDLEGTPVWEKLRNATLVDAEMRPSAVATDASGNLFVGGGTGVSGGGNAGARIEKLGPDGAPIWAQILDEPGGSTLYLNDMIESGDGGVIWAGEVQHLAPGWEAYPVFGKLDANGVIQWTHEFDFAGASTDGRFHDVVALADGGLLLAGSVNYEDQPWPDSLVDSWNLLAVKVDASQILQWATVIGTIYWDEGFAACEGDDGTLVVGGNCSGEAHAACLVGLAPDGTMRWSRTYAGEEIAGSSGDTVYDTVTRIVPWRGGYVVTGTTGLPNATRDGWTFAVDWDGVTTSFKSYRGSEQDHLTGLVALDEGFLSFGFSQSIYPNANPLLATDLWLVRTNVDHHLDFDAAFGFDGFNDSASWAPADFAALAMPGSLAPLSLETTSGAQGYDVVTSTVTTLSP